MLILTSRIEGGWCSCTATSSGARLCPHCTLHQISSHLNKVKSHLHRSWIIHDGQDQGGRTIGIWHQVANKITRCSHREEARRTWQLLALPPDAPLVAVTHSPCVRLASVISGDGDQSRKRVWWGRLVGRWAVFSHWGGVNYKWQCLDMEIHIYGGSWSPPVGYLICLGITSQESCV